MANQPNFCDYGSVFLCKDHEVEEFADSASNNTNDKEVTCMVITLLIAL